MWWLGSTVKCIRGRGGMSVSDDEMAGTNFVLGSESGVVTEQQAP